MRKCERYEGNGDLRKDMSKWKERYAQYERKDMPNEGSGDLRKDMLKSPSSLKLPLAALLLPALGKLTPGTIMMYNGSQWILMICFFHFSVAPYWCSTSAQRYPPTQSFSLLLASFLLIWFWMPTFLPTCQDLEICCNCNPSLPYRKPSPDDNCEQPDRGGDGSGGEGGRIIILSYHLYY